MMPDILFWGLTITDLKSRLSWGPASADLLPLRWQWIALVFQVLQDRHTSEKINMRKCICLPLSLHNLEVQTNLIEFSRTLKMDRCSSLWNVEEVSIPTSARDLSLSLSLSFDSLRKQARCNSDPWHFTHLLLISCQGIALARKTRNWKISV